MQVSGSVRSVEGGRLPLRAAVPEWLFPVLLAPCCLFVLMLTFVTPPLEVPDEMQHLYRAYQIGDPSATGRVEKGEAGADLPVALSDMTEHFLGTKAIHAPRAFQTHPWRDTAAYNAVPLDPDRRAFTNFGSQIIYAPLGYLPQAAGVALARAAGWGPLGLLYAARIANAVVALGVVLCAIRLLPSGRAMIAATAFLPMAAYEIASASADGQVIAFGLLYTAIALRGLQTGRWTPLEMVAALVAGIIVTTVKFPYFPLVALGLPALLRKPRDTSVIPFTLGIPAVCALAALAWLHHVAPLVVVTRPELSPTNAADQLAYLRAHPAAIFGIAVHTLLNARNLLTSTIGNFGWLNSPLPLAGVLVGVGCLVCAAVCRPHLGPIVARATGWWALLMFGASAALTSVALYLTWTPVGAGEVMGLQGRYVLPMMPALLLGLGMAAPAHAPPQRTRLLECACLVMALMNAALTLWILVHRYRLIG